MNKHDGSTLDSLLDELGELEEVNARAAKKTLAIQAARRMKQLGLTTTALAARMHTSRNQVHRILDERDAGITLRMLFRLASALDLSLRLALGSQPLRRPRGRSKEIARRAARVRSGESKGRPADEVFDRIEAKLRAR